jgi:UDPglucose 6-dehydrogenase
MQQKERLKDRTRYVINQYSLWLIEEKKMHRIGIIGTGYVGLVTGACLSDFGLEVTCFDIDETKIDMLNAGKIPIYESQLDMVVERNTKTGRLKFVKKIEEMVHATDVIFVAVGTPSTESGSADLTYVEQAVRSVARHMNADKVIVSKSTVPVGTARKIKEWLNSEISKRQVNFEADVIANPEFLREGSAVYDFMHPDRVIIGYDSENALSVMKSVYRVLYLNETPFIETNLETAEMIKYASNAFLALKITYINQIANLCEAVGANVLDVAKGMGKDGRISPKFLHPGPGFGGSCFPKDTRALIHIGVNAGEHVTLMEEASKINEAQKLRMVEKIEKGMGSVNNKLFAVLGLSFKPNTDDMREAPSLTIIKELAGKGASFRVFDPASIESAKGYLAEAAGNIEYCGSEYETMKGADALLILTEWNQFRNLDLSKIKGLMNGDYFFDLRNIYRRKNVEESGFKYFGVGV